MGAARSSRELEDPLWCRVESLLVRFAAEKVARASIDRLWRRSRVDFHPAHWTDGAARGRHWRMRIGNVGLGVQPPPALVLHVIGCDLCRLPPVVTLDHAQREIDPRSEPACGGEIAVLDESRPAPELDVREVHG